MAISVKKSRKERVRYEKGGWLVEEAYTVAGVLTKPEAIAAVGDDGEHIPPFNAQHPEPQYARLKVSSLEADRASAADYWNVTVGYSIPDSGDEHQEAKEDALDEEPIIGWSKSVASVPVDRDVNGNAILNSAGDRPSTWPTREVINREFTVRRKERNYDAAIAERYEGKFNSLKVTIRGVGTFAPWSLKLLTITPATEYPANVEVQEIVYAFRIVLTKINVGDTATLLPGHKCRFLDQGFRARWGTDGAKSGPIVDASKNPVVTEVRLNGQGAPADAEYKVKDDTDTPVAGVDRPARPAGMNKVTIGDAIFMEFDNDFTADLNDLGLS